jgi:hypothetical protein
MPRPSAEVIMTMELPNDESIAVLHSQGVWVLAYNGAPCALREHYWAADGAHVKYPRTGYNNEAHCQRLADKMNKQFKTNKFTCLEVVRYNGEKTLLRRLTSE